jgi:hypothetical protein
MTGAMSLTSTVASITYCNLRRLHAEKQYPANPKKSRPGIGLKIRPAVFLSNKLRAAHGACRPWCAPPCYRDVHCHRGRCCRNSRCLRSARRAVGCYRAAPTVPGDYRQRQGARMRSEHRRADAAASSAAPGNAAASSQGPLTRLLSVGDGEVVQAPPADALYG